MINNTKGVIRREKGKILKKIAVAALKKIRGFLIVKRKKKIKNSIVKNISANNLVTYSN